MGATHETNVQLTLTPTALAKVREFIAAEQMPAETVGLRLGVIDYVATMQSAGFTFENPNASGGCGCGTSFSV
jgi:Fe-S cluster assembly iron-binding protein IscA